MIEHMVMWVVVAPLLAAGAPIRLAFFVLPRNGRRRLARWLHSRPATVLTSPVGSVTLFAAVILVTHIPAVYGLSLANDYAHEAEHALYLISALLIWAPLLGVDPLPHRIGPRGRAACVAACMLPMALIALWLGLAREPVYGHYVATLGAGGVRDQRLAATVMWVCCLPALAAPALRGLAVARTARVRSQPAARVVAVQAPDSG
jgi:putative copper resistance protein D